MNQIRPTALCGFIFFCSVPSLATPPEPDLAVGDRCVVTQPLRLWAKPTKKGEPAHIEDGAELRILNIRRGWTHVESQNGKGYAKTRHLKKVCSHIDTPEPEPTPSTSVPDDVVEAPPSKEESGSVSLELEEPPDVVPATPERPVEIPANPPLEAAQGEPAASRDAEKITLAVMDLQPRGVSSDLAANLTQVVASELAGLGPFSVLSRQDIIQMLQFEVMKDQLGCDDTTCLAEIGGALGAAYVISGNVGKVGDALTVNLQLLNIRHSVVAGRESRDVTGGETDLVQQARGAAKRLVSGLLEQQSGALIVRVNESDAEVELDNDLIGVTPLRRLEVAGGTHRVKVSKEGFLVWARDIDVQPKQATVADVSLIPSPEYVASYENRATAYRVLAWVCTGLGVIAAGGGFGYLASRQTRRNNLDDDIKAFNSGNPREGVTQEKLERRYDRLNRDYLISQVVGLSGVVILGAAAFFWLAGDDPGKYREFRTDVDDVPALGRVFVEPQPTRGGGAFVVGADF